jgi:antitoxin MazE
MVKKLTPHGNSRAVVIDRPILELLKIDDDTPLQISTDGQRLIITPIQNGISDKELTSVLAHVNKRHGRTLRRLAE